MRQKHNKSLQRVLALAAGILLLPLGQMLSPGCAAAATPQPGSDPATLKPLTPRLAPTATAAAQTKSQPASAAAPAKGTTKAAAAPAMPPEAPPIEKFRQVAELEKLMFGVAQPNIPIEYRLDRLESEVFHHTNPDWDTKRRIDRLNETLVGGGPAGSNPGGPAGYPAHPAAAGGEPYQNGSGYTPQPAGIPQYGDQTMPPYGDPAAQYGGAPYGGAPYASDPSPPPTVSTAANYIPAPKGDLNSADFQQERSMSELQQYALDVINDARVGQGLAPLSWDDTAGKVAQELITDNCARSTVSHQNKDGDNPDRRYTKAGGTNCMVETIDSLASDTKPVMNKTLVYNMLKDMVSHQDDRDALFNAHASHGAFAIGYSSGSSKVIGCTEIVTKCGEVASLSPDVKVGDKLDVKGIISGPYRFARITVAWEGLLPTSGEDAEPQDEAIPYFPPLDYEAHAKKSEHDWQKGKQILQLTGIVAAIAGGVVFPPVALAAPLIAATGPATIKPKAVSDIPVRGGVHVDGAAFSHKLQLSKDNKEGIYYVTVWANSDADPTPFAISRRAIIARGFSDNKAADPKISEHNEEAQVASGDVGKKTKHSKRDHDDSK